MMNYSLSRMATELESTGREDSRAIKMMEQLLDSLENKVDSYR